MQLWREGRFAAPFRDHAGGDEGLHLHILRCHQRTGHMPQVDPLISLVDVIRTDLILCRNTAFRQAHQASLYP